MKIFKAVIVFSILLIILLFANTCNVHSREIEEIVIKNQVIKKLPKDHNFIGVNWQNEVKFSINGNITTYNNYIFSNPDQLKELHKILNETGTDLIRYPGGDSVAKSFYDVSSRDYYVALKKWSLRDKNIHYWSHFKPNDRIMFEDFMKFCKEGHIKATVQLNPHNYFDKGNIEILQLKTYEKDTNGKRLLNTGKVNWQLVDKAADYAASEVEWVNKNGYSDIVKYWEIGNEEYLNVPLSPYYTPEEYSEIAAIFVKKILKKDPYAKIIITGGRGDWLEKVVNSTTLKPLLNKVYTNSKHMYPTGKTKKDNTLATFIDNVYNNSSLDFTEGLKKEAETLKQYNYKPVYFLNEFNPSLYTNQYSHSWIGAIGSAKIILNCAISDYCYHADYFNLIFDTYDIKNDDLYKNTGYGMIHHAKDFQMPFIKYPVANVIELLNNSIKDNILEVENHNVDVYATASIYKDKINVIILNTRKDREINFKINDMKKLKYTGNTSLGINVSPDFRVVNTNDSKYNPQEVRLLNPLTNAIKIDADTKQNSYKTILPKDTLSVFSFQIAE